MRFTPRADEDLVEIAAYIWADNPEAGGRFIEAARATAEGIAAHPGKGASFRTDREELQGVRWVGVEGFPNHLMFYRSDEAGVVVLRVLHGARDLPGVMEEG